MNLHTEEELQENIWREILEQSVFWHPVVDSINTFNLIRQHH
jgi:hypothetical protein